MTTVQRAPPVSGSQSQVEPSPRIVSTAPRQAVLHLRGARRTSEDDGESSSRVGNRRRIRWAEDVVDNEGLGRKSSKVCCIYHAPRPIDESSDESSSSSDSDSDSGDDGSARPSRKESCGHNHNHGKDKASRKRRPSPNAYEKVPKNKGSGGTTMKQ